MLISADQQGLCGLINQQLLSNISQDRYQRDQTIRYRKSPVFQQFMARRNFGHRSGIVVDCCKNHGVWLDAGELIHL
jgi:hypothetical protein